MTDSSSSREPLSDAVRLEVDMLDSLPAKADAESRSDGSGLTLLVADDDPEIRLYVRRCVKSMTGIVGRVIEASDGREALESLRRGEAEFLVCDVLMPGLDGFELCLAVRADSGLRRLPILLITGQMPLGQGRRRAEEAGADAILAKPFNARRLCEAIEQVLHSRASRGGSEDPCTPDGRTP